LKNDTTQTAHANICASPLRALLALAVMLSMTLSSLTPAFASETPDPPATDCLTVYTYDLHTGEVLYSKEASTQRTCASITKVMTCVLVLENLDMDTVVTVPEDGVFQTGSNMELEEGEELTVDQLVHCMMIESANDAALTLAIQMSGSEEAFVELMNQKAQELGMEHTYYLSCNGYTEDEAHTTTAEDLGKLANYALSVPGFKEIVGTAYYELPATNKHEARTFETTNQMLFDTETTITVNGQERTPKYEGTYGIKTGMMGSSMYCFLGAVKRGDMDLITVCLYGEEDYYRWQDCIAVNDWAFENFKTVQVIKGNVGLGTIKVKGGAETEVTVTCPDDIYVTTAINGDPDSADMAADSMLSYDMPDHVEGPIAAGTKVGTIKVTRLNGEVEEHDVIIPTAVEQGGPWSQYYLFDNYISDATFYHWLKIALAVLGTLVLLIVILVVRGRRRRRREQMRRRRVTAQRGGQLDPRSGVRADPRTGRRMGGHTNQVRRGSAAGHRYQPPEQTGNHRRSGSRH